MSSAMTVACGCGSRKGLVFVSAAVLSEVRGISYHILKITKIVVGVEKARWVLLGPQLATKPETAETKGRCLHSEGWEVVNFV